MDDTLFAHIQRKLPTFNLDVTRGLACKHMSGAEAYIENIMRCAESGFPPGLRYVGPGERVSPQESFNVTTAKRSVKMMYELSQSDIYLMRYRFEYNGEMLRPFYFFLPYVRPGGIIHIMGSIFSISPVLADKALSVGEDSIYIPMNRAKLTFKRHVVHFFADGKRHSQNVVWCNAHNGHKKSRDTSERKTISADATLVHYLLCKYGLTKTFALFNTHIVAGNGDMVNESTFPLDKWVICRSTKDKPLGVYNKFYVGTDICLAVPRENFNNNVATAIAGFFYIADRFPDRMESAYCEDTNFWRVLLGHIVYATNENEGKLLNNINKHIESLDGYVDKMVRQWLIEDNIPADDVYGLFFSMMCTFSTRLMDAQQSLASMFGKRLMVLRYVLIDIIKAIFNMMFALKEASKKNLTVKDVEKILHKCLKPLLIIKMNHKHAEVTSVSSSGDCMAYKITSNLVLQADIGAGSNSKSTKLDATKTLDVSIAVAGQFNRLPKGEPTGRKNINPFVKLDGQDTIIPHDDDIDLINRTKFNIRR